MEILDFCINAIKEFPLKKYYQIDKDFEYILGIVTKGQINKQILDEIKEKSSNNVTYFGYAMIDNKVISFFEIKNVISSRPLLNSINRYLGNKDKFIVNYVPSLKEMCINVWGEQKFTSILVDDKKIDVKCFN